MSGLSSASKLVKSCLAIAMVVSSVSCGFTIAFADPDPVVTGPSQPIPPGTKVVHEFDVVVANVYNSVDEIPSGEAPMTISQSTIDRLLSDSAQWWSDNTGLDFDFSQNTRYRAINTTCERSIPNAMAAFGQPEDDYTYYTDSNKDMVILDVDTWCGSPGAVGQAWTVPPQGNVFAGGMLEMLVQPYTMDYEWQSVVDIISHELGHTLGLLHSNLLDCSTRSISGDDHIGVTWDGTYMLENQDKCTLTEYGDPSTIMTSVQEANGQILNSLQKWYLGVAADVDVIDQPTQTTITVSRQDLTDSDFPRGVVIPYESGGWSVAFGVDYHPANEDLARVPGIYLTYAMTGSSLGTDLLVPPGNRFYLDLGFDQPLEEGQTFVSADGMVSIRTVAVDETTATVEISVGKNLGVDGYVSIQRDGDSFAAVVTSAQATNVTYQWFRNGTPIGDAVEATYTPTLPDPNAVYRVEATLTGDGRGPTTRRSRGIMADDQRFTMDGDTATFMFLDENGQPRDCTDGTIVLTVKTSSGAVVSHTSTTMSSTGVLGVCQGNVNFPLFGSFMITAESVDDFQRTYIDMKPEWLEPYWEPLTTTWTRTATEATAVLLVSSNDSMGFLYVNAGMDEPPLPVAVSVTKPDGTPAEGVPVSLTIPEGMMLTPHQPLVTGSDGIAYAELQWDPTSQPPSTSVTGIVEASVPGFDQVQSSPVELYIGSPSIGTMTAWLDKTTAILDGTDSLTLHVRAWDESGELIENQPEMIQGEVVSSVDFMSEMGAFSLVTWDDVSKEYIVTVTAERAGSGRVNVWLADNPDVVMMLYPEVTFLIGPATGFDIIQTSGAVASHDGVCDSDDSAAADVTLWPVSYQYEQVDLDEPGIIVSVPDGSPLTIVGGPNVTAMDNQGWYHFQVMSSRPGSFDITVTSMDHSVSETQTLFFGNGLIDTQASSVTVTDGLRAADGTASHTVTANLVTQCHVPLVTDLGDWSPDGLDLDIQGTNGSDSSATETTGFVADPDQPGVYTANVTSTEPGTYNAVVTLDHTIADGTQAATTLATLPMQFGEEPSPSSSVTPSPSSSVTPSPSNPTTSMTPTSFSSPTPSSSTTVPPSPTPSSSTTVPPSPSPSSSTTVPPSPSPSSSTTAPSSTPSTVAPSSSPSPTPSEVPTSAAPSTVAPSATSSTVAPSSSPSTTPSSTPAGLPTSLGTLPAPSPVAPSSSSPLPPPAANPAQISVQTGGVVHNTTGFLPAVLGCLCLISHC